jgi:hypothetical protein
MEGITELYKLSSGKLEWTWRPRHKWRILINGSSRNRMREWSGFS